MEALHSQNITSMFLSLGLLIGSARLLGEMVQKIYLPSVVGELLAGVLLGPTVLGAVAPEINLFLFPQNGANAVILDALSNLAIVLFLMVAGLEVDLSTIWRQGRAGAKIGLASVAVPFLFGLAAAWLVAGPLGRQPKADPVIFALFLAIAISISALPIIAKTLMDLDLYRSDLGMTVISAAIFNDLIGWLIFAVVLGLLEGSAGNGRQILTTIGLTLAFAGGVLTLGRRMFDKILPFIQAYARWPGGELSFAMFFSLLGAALTEWIGVHAIFGAFFVGAALGDSAHLREHTRVTIDHFISYIFAPLFFSSIGLNLNFAAYFDLPVVLTVCLTAGLCKIIGATLGARWGGLQSREAWAVGFAMVSVGAMGVIVGLTALRANIIHPRLFVAITIMAMVTSMISGPAIRILLRPPKKWQLADCFSGKLFLRDLKSSTPGDVIHEMALKLCQVSGLDLNTVTRSILQREELMSTGIGNGIALPHARLKGISKPLIAMGISNLGIDFDAPDNKPATIIFLILTPVNDAGLQLTIASELARLFRDPRTLARAQKINKYTDFLALMRTSI